jgi:serine/threonine protein kinase/tetratricopeptide (TPR) repeat protein
MKSSPSLSHLQNGDDPALFDLAEEMADRLQTENADDLEAWIAAQGEHAERLRRLLPTVRVMAELGSAASSSAPPTGSEGEALPGVLGDFHIIREVGRGGMGVVYEAEQVSLGRRVALKVLPFAATMDPRHLQRFHNEARAAACLHHEHIVPVHAVGQERGVHYYAMQFIDGLTLAQFLAHQRGTPPDHAEQPATTPTPPASDQPAARTVVAGAETTAQLPRDLAEFRRIAEWGIQAALALEHAHQLGIVHRDIKPGNLMLDAQGRLWITDFGLARIGTEAGLTLSGDLVGTLRYMSPEQALAKRGVIDHRTDLYSLGATLYEVLVLRPAFAGNDREEVLRQIAFEEPTPPRQINSAIPTELETIVLKALEKNPAERYATAQELADDLRNWLEDRPIQARRPGVGVRLAKWARRHRPLVAATVLCLVMALAAVGGSVGWVLGEQANRQQAAEAKVREALDEGVRRLQEGNPDDPVLITMIQQAQAQVDAAVLSLEWQGRVGQLRRDLDMLRRLEEARLQAAAGGQEEGWDWTGADRLYREAFQGYGLDVLSLEPGKCAEQVRRSATRTHLVVALDYWAFVRDRLHKGSGASLRAVAERSDDDPWREGVRRAVARGDRIALVRLAKEAAAERQSPASIELLSYGLRPVEKEELLRAAQQHHPADFWINFDLAHTLSTKESPDLGQVISFYRAALALRPQSPIVHINLGFALDQKGDVDGAIKAYREALRFKMDLRRAHAGLGSALRNKGDLNGSIKEYHEALRLKNDAPEVHFNLGNALLATGDHAGAIREYREALCLKQNYPKARYNLAVALEKKGDLDEAIKQYQEALRLKRNYPEARFAIGTALYNNSDLAGAVKELREAVHLRRDYPEAHVNLGNALHKKGELNEAIQEYQEALRLKPDLPLVRKNLGIACYDLGNALLAKGDRDGAIHSYREALRYKKDSPEALCNLGHALKAQGQFSQALKALQRGHQLGSKRPGWPYPSAQWVQACKRLVELDARLPDILAGKAQSADAAERIALAEVCHLKGLYRQEARFYEEAFADQPNLAGDVNEGRGYDAACAAALAGCGQGKDADQSDYEERSQLRQQALKWLLANLALWAKQVAGNRPKDRAEAERALQHWLKDPDFTRVRGQALARLPKAERQAWQQLWADVADLLARARAEAVPQKKPGGK